MFYDIRTGMYKFGNNTYSWHIRRRSNLGHIFREKVHLMGWEIGYLLTMQVLPTFPHCTSSKVLYDLSQSFFYVPMHTNTMYCVASVAAMTDMTMESS
jgi:hypothetical protein